MFYNYGGRGISVCEEWKNDYITFRNWALENGYKEELQIDRINNNGNYEPNNCRWVTSKINGNNKRNNRLITYKNKTMTLKSWCEKLGLKYKFVWQRIVRHNWSVKDAFEIPAGPDRGNQYTIKTWQSQQK